MRRALVITLSFSSAPGLPWVLLLAEFSLFLLLVTGDGLPTPLLAALQLFLRF